MYFKGIVYKKNTKILPLYTHPHVVPNPQHFSSSSEHKLDILDEIRELSDTA